MKLIFFLIQQPAPPRIEDNKNNVVNSNLNNEINKDKLINQNDQNKNVDIQQQTQQSQINQQSIPPKQEESPEVMIVETTQNITSDSKLPLDKSIEKSINTQHPLKQETVDNNLTSKGKNLNFRSIYF